MTDSEQLEDVRNRLTRVEAMLRRLMIEIMPEHRVEAAVAEQILSGMRLRARE